MNKTYFGKRIVRIERKKFLVQELFDNVSHRYDLMNDFMSLGFHRLWKKRLINSLDAVEPSMILDLAGGTGDISLLLSKKYPCSSIIIYDLSFEMMLKSKKKITNKNISLINGSAEQLSIADNSIDLITLSFGLRNFSNLKKSISECYRVLRYGGKLYCLEFSPSYDAYIKTAYDFYSDKIIPKIGKFVAKNEEAYKYLVESIRNFPQNSELKNIFNKAGFFCYNDIRLMGGIAILNIFSKV